jgi:hypothetical protein
MKFLDRPFLFDEIVELVGKNKENDAINLLHNLTLPTKSKDKHLVILKI